MNRAQRRQAGRARIKEPVEPDRVVVGFCYGQSTQTPQWRRSLNFVYLRDAYSYRRIIGELAHEASGVHIPHARSAMVQHFLDNPLRPDWLWMVDTDATFADTVLEQLIEAADKTERPIVGALAFGVRVAQDEHGREKFNEVGAAALELFPTLYVCDADGNTNRIDEYPPDQLVQVHATGAHCLLIHRSVLEHDGWRDSHPLPWFRTATIAGREVSEDHYFCMKAGSLGFPIYVHTGIKTGHVKTFVADESLYLAQRTYASQS